MNILQQFKKKQLQRKNKTLNEALGDLRYMDDKMIAYFEDVLSDPKKKAEYVKACAHYDKLAKTATNRVDALYYEYRMLLPEKQALALAREFYQKDIRNNVVSLAGEYELENDSDNDGSNDNKGYAQSLTYSDDLVDLDIFNSLKSENPETKYEVEDFFDKVINNPKLNRFDRLVLLTNLYLGSAPNSKTKKSSKFTGLDLPEIMSNVPKEWDEIVRQVKTINMDAIEPHPTADKILYGVSAKDTKSGKGIPSLLSNKQKAKSMEKIKQSVKELAGVDEFADVAKWVFGGINENNKSSVQKLQEAINKNRILTVLITYLSGKPVKKSELISLIVHAVNANLEYHTLLAKKSPIFKEPFMDICRYYKKLANSKKEADIVSIQTLIMSPVIDKMVKPKLKTIVKR